MVDENFGTVNLTVELIGTICGEIEIDFRVSNGNHSFTATGMILQCTMLNLHIDQKCIHCTDFCTTTEDDYTIVTMRPLVLSTEVLSINITIDINDDDLFEPAESFEISLFFKEQPVIPRVTLDPKTANITIQGMRF